jgi:hypothetical protein
MLLSIYQSTLSLATAYIEIQIDVTMEEIGTRTDETGIPGSPVGAMSESDETHLGGMERRTGIGMIRRRGKARRVGMQNPSQRGLYGWIQSPGRQRNLCNRTVRPYSSLMTDYRCDMSGLL